MQSIFDNCRSINVMNNIYIMHNFTKTRRKLCNNKEMIFKKNRKKRETFRP